MKPPAKGEKILLKRENGQVTEETCHQSRSSPTHFGVTVEVVTTRDYEIGAQYALFFDGGRELMMCDHIGRFGDDDNLKAVTFSTFISPT